MTSVDDDTFVKFARLRERTADRVMSRDEKRLQEHYLKLMREQEERQERQERHRVEHDAAAEPVRAVPRDALAELGAIEQREED